MTNNIVDYDTTHSFFLTQIHFLTLVLV